MFHLQRLEGAECDDPRFEKSVGIIDRYKGAISWFVNGPPGKHPIQADDLPNPFVVNLDEEGNQIFTIPSNTGYEHLFW